MVKLYTSFYDEKNEIRRKEILHCLKKNVECEYVDEIFVMLENGTSIPNKNKKITYINCDYKPTYKLFFDFINEHTKEDDINIIANSDIFFDATLQQLNQLKENDCWALSRWEINSDGSYGQQVQNRGDSQDVWIFKGLIKDMPNCDFNLGKLGCDNKIAHELKEAGYNIINPSKSIKVWHNHSSEIRGASSSTDEPVPPPYYFPILPCYLTSGIEPIKINKEQKLKLLHVGLSATGLPYNGLQKAFIQHYIYEEIHTGAPNINETMLSKVAVFKPDIVFIQIQSEGYIWEQTIIDIKATGAFVLNHTGDVRYPIPEWYYGIGQYLDLTLFTNMTDVETMRNRGYRAEYLEMGFDPEIYKPGGEYILSHPIVFMGNHYGHFPLSDFRYKMVLHLQKKFQNKFGVYGSGWPQNGEFRVSGNYNDSQPNEAMIYRASQIAINISHFNYKKYSSDRMLRILGSGVFCLCYKYPNMPYTDGVHLRTWENFEELEHLCNYYLAHPLERRQIAENGCNFAHANFTFENMVIGIKKIYDEYK